MKGSFFCEACGAEVRGRADRCPGCGRSFLGIRCPRCGREGNADEFVKGCPDCGYMADSAADGVGARPAPKGRPEPRRLRPPAWPPVLYWILSAALAAGLALGLAIWLT